MGRLIETLLGILIAACLLAPFAAHAESHTAKVGKYLFTLKDEKCTNKASPFIGMFERQAFAPQYQGVFEWHEASAEYDGRKIDACWMITPDGFVGIVDERKYGGFFPAELFMHKKKPAPQTGTPKWRDEGRLWSA